MNNYYFAVTGSHVEAEKNSSGTGSPLLPESAGGGSQVYPQQKHHSPWSETGQHAAEWKDATQNRRFWISHKNDIRRRKENVGFLFSWMHFWNLFDRVSDNWWVTLKNKSSNTRYCFILEGLFVELLITLPQRFCRNAVTVTKQMFGQLDVLRK